MKVRILSFGKLKTPGLKQSAEHYEKQLRRWVKLDQTELKPWVLHTRDERALAQKKETERLSQALKQNAPRSRLVLLDETGRAGPTHEWVQRVQKWESSGCHEVTFCLGSSVGFSQEAKKKADAVYSLGPQTLSHELSRVVLLEQLYRAWSVTRNHPYHIEG